MDRLQANFGAQIDFYHIDTDDVRQLQAGRKLGLFRHTQYILVDGEGEILGEWNGYLNQEEVAIVLDAALITKSGLPN